MYWLLSASLLAVVMIRSFFDLAALVPMGIAVIAANRSWFTLTRSEWFAFLYAGVLVLCLAVAFYLYSHTHIMGEDTEFGTSRYNFRERIPTTGHTINTDERAGLVASLAAKCAEKAVSLEISTGPGHVVLTFQASEQTVADLSLSLSDIEGLSM